MKQKKDKFVEQLTVEHLLKMQKSEREKLLLNLSRTDLEKLAKDLENMSTKLEKQLASVEANLEQLYSNMEFYVAFAKPQGLIS